uniref:Transmembrane protein n=1 Tax=Cyanothece sp. (strain PCC 7425 / ATCC 29141) TaxID=395961 RepID=B8HZ25_CYAP4
MFRLIVLSALWTTGLTPIVISLLLVIAIAGKPIPCDRTACTGKTYGWQLLILPGATTLPFLAGLAIAYLSSRKNRKRSNNLGSLASMGPPPQGKKSQAAGRL